MPTKDRSSRSSQTRREHIDEVWEYVPPDEGGIPEPLRQKFLDMGYKLRWVRYMLNGTEDVKQINKRRLAGWEFVTQAEIGDDLALPFAQHVKEYGRLSDIVVHKDVALAKCPLYKANARTEFFRKRAAEQRNAVNERLGRENAKHPSMPITNSSRSRVEVPSSRPDVQFATDGAHTVSDDGWEDTFPGGKAPPSNFDGAE